MQDTQTRREIVINDGLSRITKLTIKTYDQPEMYRISKWKEQIIEESVPGFGLHFVADETARAVRDGLLEHPRMPHEETLIQMEVSITSLDHTTGAATGLMCRAFRFSTECERMGDTFCPREWNR